MKKTKVIFDTNVIISASLSTNSVPQRALDQAIGTCKILISQPIIQEIATILQRPKFDRYISQQARRTFLEKLLESALIIQVVSTITDCRDPKDNKFLELAVDGQADYLITGDQDLLVLHPFRNTKIITPAQFLDENLN